MDALLLPAVHRAAGTVKLPGSKSISNRTLLLAALAHGNTQIHDLLRSDDTERMLQALQTLGVALEKTAADDWRVTGVSGKFPVKQAQLFLGNAGTAFRPLTAVLALSGGNYELSGVPRMHERPIGDLVDALLQAGADIDYLGEQGFPPLQIKPNKADFASTISIRGDVSSQFLTALLMALPLTGQSTTIQVIGELISKPYIEITLNLMARFGVKVERDAWKSFTIPADSRYVSPGAIHVEGDASSASYFLAAGAIAGTVKVEGVGADSIQG
ncbi:MAG TPA: 3-phosphoshikimate 1-carboxyvinyltransferase, partial [Methylophilaceae bacterium]